jgi:hypothetical protein
MLPRSSEMSTTIGASTIPDEADGKSDRLYIIEYEGRPGEPSACSGNAVGGDTIGGPEDIY